ncbi:unnamed protein product [Phytophthora fragariaefolia]|uniref:Unnamed protein product n=1 Tax=Phytophthora fragariaefolia TaxID=1490495 RepID=A0A9W7CTB7_9STRA|nr:unnamed protein product [Phytophthora fragariaefolia]
MSQASGSTQYGTAKSSAWGDSPAFSTRSKEVKKLRRKVSKIRISAADAVIPTDAANERRAVDAPDTKSSVGAESAASGSQERQVETGSQTRLKKKKRVTRSVSITSDETGAEFLDTPTKASHPPKRFRKYSRDLGSGKKAKKKESSDATAFSLEGAESERVKKEATNASKDNPVAGLTPRRRTSVTVTLPLRRSRRLQHITAESPKPAALVTLQSVTSGSTDAQMLAKQSTDILPIASSQGPGAECTQAPDVPVDLVSSYCDTLLATDTISGCFFALSLNALRNAQLPLGSTSMSSESNPLGSVVSIYFGIAECEGLAQRSFPSKTPKTPKLVSSKSPKSPNTEVPRVRRRISLKDIRKTKQTKKSVRFRTFDLSCLNLQYVEDEQVAIMVDKILTRYGAIMDHVETMIKTESNPSTRQVLRELVRVMASPSELYNINQSGGGDVVESSKQLYSRAYGGRDPYSQHEIRICGEYFARQFTNLLAPRSPSSTPQFLQGVFSSLASSSIRFKLRVLFIESEDFGENLNADSQPLLDDGGRPFPTMAPYEHQDLGAAIHWALQESILYWSLVQPLFEILGKLEGLACNDFDGESPLKKYLEKSAPEDLDHMEKYVLARRFLRYHLTKSWRRRLKDTDAHKIWTTIEEGCMIAKRFNFEDEAHLYPLASVEDFVAKLAQEEAKLQQMEETLQAFYEQKYGKEELALCG